MNGRTCQAPRHAWQLPDGAHILVDEHGCLCVRENTTMDVMRHTLDPPCPLKVGSCGLVSLVFCMGIE